MQTKPLIVAIAALLMMSATALVPQQQGQQQAAPAYHPDWSPVAFEPVPPPPGTDKLEPVGRPGTTQRIRPGGERFAGLELAPLPVRVPDGFTPIFNGQNLSGWHTSRTNIHGTTPNFFVMHGVLLGTQSPLGSGGILITDRKFKNFELYMEVKPDWGCDSGLFFRTTEDGVAYQITLDYLPTGMLGNVNGENGLAGVGGARGAAPPVTQKRGGLFDDTKAWKREEWNAIRVRVEGETPHVQMWVNDVLVTDFTDVKNNAINGMSEAPIAIQVHGLLRWRPGGFWRWRNIGVKEL
jgi:3-keto-disaccharide hydrolase